MLFSPTTFAKLQRAHERLGTSLSGHRATARADLTAGETCWEMHPRTRVHAALKGTASQGRLRTLAKPSNNIIFPWRSATYSPSSASSGLFLSGDLICDLRSRAPPATCSQFHTAQYSPLLRNESARCGRQKSLIRGKAGCNLLSAEENLQSVHGCLTSLQMHRQHGMNHRLEED